MTDLDSIGNRSIPIQKIISIACRNYIAFEGLHIFEFEDGVNTIVGGNASGKSCLVSAILQSVSKDTVRRWNSGWTKQFSQKESLIELKFIAGDKEHYLRRLIVGDNTTDLHLYVGNGERRDFYRDGEVLSYFRKLKPISTIDMIGTTKRDFFFWTNGRRSSVNPMFEKSEMVLDQVNRYLPLGTSGITKLCLLDNVVVAEKNGELTALSALAGGEIRQLFMISKILNIMHRIETEQTSKVIVIDEFEIGLDRPNVDPIYKLMESVAEEYGCQLIITSRFSKGRANPIRLRTPKVRDYYTGNPRNHLRGLIKNSFANSKQKIVYKSPPFFGNFSSKSSKKSACKKGSFKWNP